MPLRSEYGSIQVQIQFFSLAEIVRHYGCHSDRDHVPNQQQNMTHFHIREVAVAMEKIRYDEEKMTHLFVSVAVTQLHKL